MITGEQLDRILEESLSLLDEANELLRREGHVWASDESRRVTHLLELARQYTALVSTATRLRQETGRAATHTVRTGGKR